MFLLALVSIDASGQKLSSSALEAEQNKKAVEETVKAYARALADLPRTRDAQTILRFHAVEFTGINDGEKYDLAKIRDTLDKVMRAIDEGNNIAISAKAENIKIEFEGDIAWASYDSIVRIKVNGKVAQDVKQKSTDKFKRVNSGWLLTHSISSTVKEPTPAYDPPSVEPQTPKQVKIVDSSFAVSPRYFQTFSFSLPVGGYVRGRFDSQGGRWSDVQVILIDAREYDNYRNNRAFRAYHNSGKVYSGSLYVLLPAGQYLLIFSNAHSTVVSSQVVANIDATSY
ncbi:MAG: nuclear transport factor 2 family protein [Blastocatellia bacterium]|nr:nuclear transport factor 2 family protein [Blastocatellia bacterium]